MLSYVRAPQSKARLHVLRDKRALPRPHGERFAFPPFMYDEAGAQLRETNAAFVDNQRFGLPGLEPVERKLHARSLCCDLRRRRRRDRRSR